ncbi:MAG: ATP-binding protein [Alphaproteobacteria bacterium]
MTAKPPSLRRILLKLIAGPLVACSLLIWSAGLVYIYHEVDEVYDATLSQFAREIGQLTQKSRMAEVAPKPYEQSYKHSYERKIAFRIFQDDKIVARSLFAIYGGEAAGDPGFKDREFKGEKWRVFVTADERTGRTVEVAEKYSIRYEMIYQLLGSLIIPAFLFLVTVVLVVWRGAGRSLARLEQLSAQVDARHVDDMSAITDSAIPREVQPLLSALNRLFGRVSESFRREKEFTDNAAHELRTPLAAIKTQAQVLQKSEKMSKAGQEGLDNLVNAIDRASGMMDSLLEFTRLEADRSTMQPVDISAIVAQELQELQRFSLWKGRNVVLKAEPGLRIRGVMQGLSVLVRNVMLNALKFTPESGAISIDVSRTADAVVFSVADTGPGIPDNMKQKVFDRFFKASKSDVKGSGLGLAMVKWIADLHAAKITLADNQPSGLVVQIRFPIDKELL